MRIRHNSRSQEIIDQCEFLIKNHMNYKGNWQSLFKNNNPIHLEIGMGKGNFILGMAKKFPDINFIGLEKYDTIVAKAIEKITVEELDNLILIKADANLINEIFESEIDVLYLNFSDPWPKAKHIKRRLTSEVFLKKYDSIFKNEKTIIQKTDNYDFFLFSKESLTDYGYVIIETSIDLHNLEKENIMTEYEQKFSTKGIKINYLKAFKKE